MHASPVLSGLFVCAAVQSRCKSLAQMAWGSGRDAVPRGTRDALTQMREADMSTTVADRREPALLMSIADVAAELRVGARTVWRWVSMGVFPAPDLALGAK